MNDRERFLATVHFNSPDRIPYWEFDLRKATLDRWHEEGMLADVNPQIYFGFDRQEFLPVDFGPVPRFKETIFKETESYKIWIDELGAKRKDFKVDRTPGFVTRTWIEFPVKTRADFIKVKERYNPNSSVRLPQYWDKRWLQRDCPLAILTIPGLFWKVREWMGFEATCKCFYDDPNWMHEMMEFIANFNIKVLSRVVKDIDLDWIMLSEDMAYKTGSMISPDMVRKFMFKHYRRLSDFLHKYDVDIILDCDGNVSELIPIWLEAGINGTTPIEVAAGMDPVYLRKKYKHDLILMGGIDKRELSKGKSRIEKEVTYKIPYLIEKGGSIPTVDHAVPPDVSFENYLYYWRLIRSIVEKG